MPKLKIFQIGIYQIRIQNFKFHQPNDLHLIGCRLMHFSPISAIHQHMQPSVATNQLSFKQKYLIGLAHE